MRKFIVGLTAVILLANLSIKAQDNSAWDLRRCVAYATENNIQVHQQVIQFQLSHLNYIQSKFSQYPSLNSNINSGWNFGRSVDQVNYTYTNQAFFQTTMGLNSSVMLFNWFSRKNTTAADKLTEKADELQVEKIKNDIALNVANLYLQVLFNIQQADINKTRMEQSRAQFDNTRKQVDAGLLPELNAVELEAQLGTDSANWIQSKTTIELSLLQLKSALNLPADTAIVIATPPVESIPVDNILEASPAVIYDMAIKSLPQFRVNDLRLQSAQKDYKAAKGMQYPNISLYGSVNSLLNDKAMEGTGNYLDVNPVIGTVGLNPGAETVNSIMKQRIFDEYRKISPWKQVSNNFNQNIGIAISIPIFNGLTAKTNVSRQKLNIYNQELLLNQDKLNMKRDIYDAYQQALGAFEKFNASKKSVESAQKAFDYATKRYDIGVLQTIQWLNNQNTLAQAKINALIAQYDYVFKMKVLEFYKGQGIKL